MCSYDKCGAKLRFSFLLTKETKEKVGLFYILYIIMYRVYFFVMLDREMHPCFCSLCGWQKK